MRYSGAAHIVNVLFIGAVFLAPIGYCLSDPSIPVEVGRAVIMVSFLLGAIAIADWYGPRLSNSWQGILMVMVFGGITALVMAGIASWRSGASFADVALFKTYSTWDGQSGGALALGIVAIPRMVLLRLV